MCGVAYGVERGCQSLVARTLGLLPAVNHVSVRGRDAVNAVVAHAQAAVRQRGLHRPRCAQILHAAHGTMPSNRRRPTLRLPTPSSCQNVGPSSASMPETSVGGA